MLYPLFKQVVEKHSQKVALQIKRNGSYVTYTYEKMMASALSLADRIKEMGIAPGTHVALWGDNIPEWAIAYCGIHFSGAIVVPLDAQLQPTVVTNLLKFCEGQLIICGENLHEGAKEVGEGLNIPVWTLEPGEKDHSIFSKEDSNFTSHSFAEDDTMSLIFTSGTTGDPKGVMLTCKNLISNAQGAYEVNEITDKDVLLCVLPLHHSYAFTSTFMSSILCGATITFQPILQGPLIIEAIQETKVSVMAAVPQLLTLFDKAIFDKIEAQPFMKKFVFYRLFSLARIARLCFGLNLGKIFFKQIHNRFGNYFRYFVSGGAKLDKQVANHFWDLGICVKEGYGLTETSPIISVTPKNAFYPGSVGPPFPGVEVKIASPGKDGIGEVAMRGSGLMKGYYKNQQATDAVIRDGWFYTGDLGYIDKRNFIYITGRAKEVIVLSSGKNIYPAEVEKAYEVASLIAEICVMGDEKNGKTERLKALVVPDFDTIKRRKINSISGEIKFEIENISTKLPSYMHFSSIKIVTKPFPRTRLGKLRRKAIEEMQIDELSDQTTVRQELTPEEQLLMERPNSQKLIERLRKLADYEEQIFPGDSLELDIGLSSLKFMELLVILEQEFGFKSTPENPPSFVHIKDLLLALPSETLSENVKDFSWKELLEKPTEPSLEQAYHLQRGFVKRLIVDTVRVVGGSILRLCFGGKAREFDRLAQHEGPVIIAPNHQSYLDPMLLYCLLPSKRLHNTFFIAIDELFSKWPFSVSTRTCRIIKTASTHTSLSSLQYAAAALKQGYSVCIFPEGERSPDGGIVSPMMGSGILACECGVPIYPVVIHGGMNAYSRTNPRFHLANMDYKMLDGIHPPQKDSYSQKDYQKMVEEWHQLVQKNYKQE